MNTESPDSQPSQGDPGDETGRRFRFQYAYAAIVCCMLLDSTQGVIEVFCEHHEDVLLKHENDSFTGVQVKTRASDQPVWKTGDVQVISAFARFAWLERLFPGRFRRFAFLTNHPLHVAANAQSIGYVLSTVASAETHSDLPRPVRSWVKKLATASESEEAVVFSALKRCRADDALPKLADCIVRLVDTLVLSWRSAEACSYLAVRQAAQALVDECGRAASLEHEQLLPGYLAASNDSSYELRARIDGKRMTETRVLRVLEAGRDAKAVLAGASETQPHPGEGSIEILAKKLDAGGFSAVSRNSAQNLRDKADYLAISWLSKYGRAKGLERYDHIRTVTLSDAARAFEATKSESSDFGPAMREDLRARFIDRRRQGDQLYDCSDDHLEGFTYTLTAACKVQWSLKLPWNDE